MHAVDGEGRWDGSLGGGETLRYYGATVDTAGSWGVPEGTGVGEHVLRWSLVACRR